MDASGGLGWVDDGRLVAIVLIASTSARQCSLGCKQGVQSDRGFIVQFTGRFSAEYRDQGKVVTLSIEDGFLGGEPCISVESDAFLRWDGGATIGPEDRARMLQNFREAVEFQGLKLVD